MSEQVIKEMKNRIKVLGSQAALAEELSVTRMYICDILAGRRAVSDNIAEQLGWKRKTTPDVWVRVKK